MAITSQCQRSKFIADSPFGNRLLQFHLSLLQQHPPIRPLILFQHRQQSDKGLDGGSRGAEGGLAQALLAVGDEGGYARLRQQDPFRFGTLIDLTEFAQQLGEIVPG
jgi:hypothetical protein